MRASLTETSQMLAGLGARAGVLPCGMCGGLRQARLAPTNHLTCACGQIGRAQQENTDGAREVSA